MSRPESKWMPLYWADYLKKTARFTLAHHGAYMLLIAEYWLTGEPIPADPEEQALIVRIPTKEWLKLRPKILEKFDEKDGYWHHERIESELAKASAIYTAKAKAGAEGAAKRWHSHSTAIAQPLANECQTQWQNDAPSPSPSHTANAVIQNPSDSGAQRPKNKKGTRLANDWQPSEQDYQYAIRQNLTGPEINQINERFRRYWTGPDCPRPTKKDWSRTWANWIDNEAPKLIASRDKANRRGAVSVADTIARLKAEAEIHEPNGDGRVGRVFGWIRPAENYDGTSEQSARNGGEIIDANDAERMFGSVGGNEISNGPEAGTGGGFRGAGEVIRQEVGELSSGCNQARFNDTSRDVEVVARMGGNSGTAGNVHTSPQGTDDGLEIPSFRDRRVIKAA